MHPLPLGSSKCEETERGIGREEGTLHNVVMCAPSRLERGRGRTHLCVWSGLGEVEIILTLTFVMLSINLHNPYRV